MVEFIKISGDIEEIKGSINYSATVLFKNESGFDELKREYLNQFLCDFKKSAKRIDIDSKIANTSVGAVNKDKRSIEGDEEKEYVRHEVLLDVYYVKHGVVLEDYLILDEGSNDDKDICYVKHGVVLEDFSDSDEAEESNYSDSDDTEESNYFDSDDTEESDYSDSDEAEESNYSDSDEAEESNYSDDQTFDFDKPLFPPEEKEYVPHGVILEDYKEDVSLGGGYSEEDEVDSGSNDDSDESGYSEDEVGSDSNDDSDESDYSEEDDSSSEDDDSKGNEDFKNKSNSNKIPNHSYTKYVRREQYKGSSEKPVVSESEAKVITKSEDSDVPVFYKSVRDFVKKNSGCSVADIKKYFSVKEIKSFDGIKNS